MADVITLDDVSVLYRQRQSMFRHSYFHALKEISFKVKKGETLGVIGRNGCGKSTLLKLLAGIYQPDKGVVDRKGYKASLLTLAAGFDPNLSGIDNAIISAMMLGHSKREVMEKLDEIVDYSEVGEFIGEPVKTYSSGMKARLGFSVAIQMKADVLLIDEVLGVGDAQFKKKAEKSMLSLINSDQTVVLVSHSAGQIRRICQRAIWLEQGQLKRIGPCADVAAEYEEFMSEFKANIHSNKVAKRNL